MQLPDRPVIALVPVALQRETEETTGSVVAAITVSLATDIEDSKTRLAAIIDSSALAKDTLCTLPRWKMEIYKRHRDAAVRARTPCPPRRAVRAAW